MAVCAAILLGGSIVGLIRGWRFANWLRRSRKGPSAAADSRRY
jgi:hypothetical protein